MQLYFFSFAWMMTWSRDPFQLQEPVRWDGHETCESTFKGMNFLYIMFRRWHLRFTKFCSFHIVYFLSRLQKKSSDFSKCPLNYFCSFQTLPNVSLQFNFLCNYLISIKIHIATVSHLSWNQVLSDMSRNKK